MNRHAAPPWRLEVVAVMQSCRDKAEHEESKMRAAVVTTFTADYELGHLTAPVNRAYAERHNYEFICRVEPPVQDWSRIARHPTWCKVALLLELLRSALADSPSARLTHILWVDADAVVLAQHVPIEDLWINLPPSIQLLIGEDVTPTCLVNAGVMCVKVSEWSLQLWSDVWMSSASVRFHRCTYHEQSALLEQLLARGEGLDSVAGRGKQPTPFHSYRGGHMARRVFCHVCVLPRHLLNTNHGDLRERHGGKSDQDNTWRCEYVFHAAGRPTLARGGPPGPMTTWRPSKADALAAMIARAGLEVPQIPAALRSCAAFVGLHAADAAEATGAKRLRWPGRIMN